VRWLNSVTRLRGRSGLKTITRGRRRAIAVRLISHTTSDGVTTRELVLGDVTAALWAPDHAAPGTPLVLLGHGGGRQHRHHPAMSGRARLLTDVGLRAVALDVEGHGPRPRTLHDEEEVAVLHAARRAGEPIGPLVERYNADLARRTVPEWRALLAGLLAVPEIGAAPVGYWASPSAPRSACRSLPRNR
jgi:pimeloyl-ACP methyl ester carboxylesterase